VTGEQLRTRRQALGLSQRQLVMLLDVSWQTIGLWERVKHLIRWPVMLRVALDAIEAS
jgi:transcriptional regulator with XRE-family HTH domain